MSLEIEHHPEEGCFRTRVDGHECILEYRREGSAACMDHVGVPAPVEGRGIASALAGAAVAWARLEGLEVVARCPYVAAWMQRHPEA